MQIAYTKESGKVRNLNDFVQEFPLVRNRFYPVRSGAMRYKVLVMAVWGRRYLGTPIKRIAITKQFTL